jgi:hypothetical protein
MDWNPRSASFCFRHEYSRLFQVATVSLHSEKHQTVLDNEHDKIRRDVQKNPSLCTLLND